MGRVRGRWRRAASASALAGLLCTAQSCAEATCCRPQPLSPFPSIVLNTQDPVVADLGFTGVDATPAQLQHLPTTLRALVWLGGYDNVACAMTHSDIEVEEQFSEYALADDDRVLGYFLADEPNTDGRCPQASLQLRGRAALVRSLDPDPSRVTLVNIDDPAQFAVFRDSADVVSTDPYPCSTDAACDWSLIPSYIQQLEAAGVRRYMAMFQAFSGDSWRWPTASELRQMIEQWRRSEWCGAITFSWFYRGARLDDHPDLLAVLREFNAQLPVPPARCLNDVTSQPT